MILKKCRSTRVFSVTNEMKVAVPPSAVLLGTMTSVHLTCTFLRRHGVQLVASRSGKPRNEHQHQYQFNNTNTAWGIQLVTLLHLLLIYVHKIDQFLRGQRSNSVNIDVDNRFVTNLMHSAEGAIFINHERTYIEKKIMKEYYILFVQVSVLGNFI